MTTHRGSDHYSFPALQVARYAYVDCKYSIHCPLFQPSSIALPIVLRATFVCTRARTISSRVFFD